VSSQFAENFERLRGSKTIPKFVQALKHVANSRISTLTVADKQAIVSEIDIRLSKMGFPLLTECLWCIGRLNFKRDDPVVAALTVDIIDSLATVAGPASTEHFNAYDSERSIEGAEDTIVGAGAGGGYSGGYGVTLRAMVALMNGLARTGAGRWRDLSVDARELILSRLSATVFLPANAAASSATGAAGSSAGRTAGINVRSSSGSGSNSVSIRDSSSDSHNNSDSSSLSSSGAAVNSSPSPNALVDVVWSLGKLGADWAYLRPPYRQQIMQAIASFDPTASRGAKASATAGGMGVLGMGRDVAKLVYGLSQMRARWSEDVSDAAKACIVSAFMRDCEAMNEMEVRNSDHGSNMIIV
jgi:hypothetical protein